MESAPTDRIKLHMRRAQVASGAFSVLMPRPSSPYRLATRAHDDTWTIVTDEPGAWFVARLVWAAAYQRRARTLVLVDGVSLRPDPSDGARSLPIVVVNEELDVPTAEDCEQLRAQLPLDSPAPGSVRLITHGLDRALADPKHYLAEWRAETEGQGSRHRHRFAPVGGVLLFAAPPAVLRRWAFDAARMVAGLEGEGSGADRTGSAQLQVIPDVWADRSDAPSGDVVSEPAGDVLVEPTEPTRRVLWQAPTAVPGT